MVPNECQRTPDSSEKSSRRFERSRRAVSRRLGTDVSSLTRGNTVEGSSGPAVAVASGLWSPCGAAELGAECLPLAGASLGARAPSGADTGTALLDIMAQLKQEREALLGMTRPKRWSKLYARKDANYSFAAGYIKTSPFHQRTHCQAVATRTANLKRAAALPHPMLASEWKCDDWMNY